ncbi:MAG: phosphoribosylaminoimidazolesuccinocarboxamide synthase [Verrucomicrobia bacterium]|nr:phosphoribosylaminoimidazolesuccinocarboxamide synthase [Verrucomicrobiota bacterium]
MNESILQLDLPGIKKVRSGKVREVFDLGDSFLLVASDRISAFDVIMPNGIPRKGEVLTQVSHFWFEKFSALVPNHLLAKADDPLPKNLQPFAEQLARRSMIVKKAKPLAIECIVRGYLSGSGLKEYKKSQTVCGIKLPAGLVDSSELPEPIFTPSTKAEQGHDENINFEQACEVLTPDSSRFWPADQYAPGKGQPSFDKQFVRDYLETLTWDKTPPGPKLPDDVVAKTSAKYLEAYERLTGKKL